MTFAEFEARAHVIFDDIPPEYREGVDGIEVQRTAVPHPTLRDIYTLGECKSELYPSEYGGAGEVRSLVVLYYGSFLELSRLDDDWDWEGELWETITHEVRHHLESLATEDALEVMDYVEDQNFARREGEAFDPLFYRMGHRRAEGVFEVDGDVFYEHALGPGRPESTELTTTLPATGEPIRLRLPDDPADVHFLRLCSPEWDEEAGDRVLVILHRRSLWDRVRAVVRGGGPSVRQDEVQVAHVAG